MATWWYDSHYEEEMRRTWEREIREREIRELEIYYIAHNGIETVGFTGSCVPMTTPPQPKDICPHKEVSPKLRTYLTQLIEYYRQAFPEHRYPVEEGATCCLKCVVEHYKKLK